MQLPLVTLVVLAAASAAVAAPVNLKSRALPTPIAVSTAKSYLSECTWTLFYVAALHLSCMS